MALSTDLKNLYVEVPAGTAKRITFTDDSSTQPSGPITHLMNENIKDAGTEQPSIYVTITT